MTKTITTSLLLLAVACRNDATGNDGESSSSSSSSTGDAPDSATVGPSSSSSGSEGVDSTDTSGGGPDPYEGEWCGNVGGATLEMGTTRYVTQLAGAGKNPIPIVVWADDGDRLLAAHYDLASAQWSDADVIATDFPSDLLPLDVNPVGAMADDGDAWLGYAVLAPMPHMVIQRFDAATLTWTREDLPEMFTSPAAVGALAAPTGDAALWAVDLLENNTDGTATVWFFDPMTETWTAEPVTAPEYWGFADTTIGALDAVRGDMMLAKSDEAGSITTWHRIVADGQTDSEVIPTSADTVDRLIALGDGAFVLITEQSTFDGPYELHAHLFDGEAWASPETLASGDDLAGVDAAGDGNGRVAVTWTEYGGAAYALDFSTRGGWAQPYALQPNDPSSPGAVAFQKVAIEELGIFATWASWENGSVSPHSSHFDGQSWSASAAMDPSQPTQFAELHSLDSLGSDRARATWIRYDEGGTRNYVYACHAPSSGWSAPSTWQPLQLVEPHPDGEVLVVFQQGEDAYAQYYAAAQ